MAFAQVGLSHSKAVSVEHIQVYSMHMLLCKSMQVSLGQDWFISAGKLQLVHCAIVCGLQITSTRQETSSQFTC